MVYFDKIGRMTLAASLFVLSAQSAYGMEEFDPEMEEVLALSLSMQTQSAQTPETDPDLEEAIFQSMLLETEKKAQGSLTCSQERLNDAALEMAIATSNAETLLGIVGAFSEEKLHEYEIPEDVQMSIVAAKELLAENRKNQRLYAPAEFSHGGELGNFVNSPHSSHAAVWQPARDQSVFNNPLGTLLQASLQIDPAAKAAQEARQRQEIAARQIEQDAAAESLRRAQAVQALEAQLQEAKKKRQSEQNGQ